MVLFENRKRSGRVLTGVVLSSSVLSAANQGIISAVPQGTNPEVTELLKSDVKNLGNQGSSLYKTIGYILGGGVLLVIFWFLLYKAAVYVRGNVGREELINEENREEQLVYLGKEKVCERFEEDRYYYGEEISSLLRQFFEENSSCEYLVYNRITKEFYATDKEGRCPKVEAAVGARRIVKCRGDEVLDFRKEFFEAAGKELLGNEGVYSEPDLKVFFSDEKKVEYSNEVKSVFRFVCSLENCLKDVWVELKEENFKSILKVGSEFEKFQRNKTGENIFVAFGLGTDDEGVINGGVFSLNVNVGSTKYLKNNLELVVKFYNFFLHEAYINGNMDKNIQFSIGKDKKTVYVEEGISEEIKKIKLKDLMKDDNCESKIFKDFVFKDESNNKISD